MIVPVPSGPELLDREGTQVGSPAQAFPKYKSVAVIDWEGTDFGATLTGRAVGKLKEVGGHEMNAVFYTDLQLRWSPQFFAERFGFAVGVNNLADVRTPGCITCESNNFSQSVHDVPGRYFYARASFKM